MKTWKLAVAVAATLALGAPAASAQQKITFTLNWVAGGDHAPYFYAQKMGWYKDAGVNVEFETGRGSAASAQKVAAGSSQLGLSDMAGVVLFADLFLRSADSNLLVAFVGLIVAVGVGAGGFLLVRWGARRPM